MAESADSFAGTVKRIQYFILLQCLMYQIKKQFLQFDLHYFIFYLKIVLSKCFLFYFMHSFNLVLKFHIAYLIIIGGTAAVSSWMASFSSAIQAVNHIRLYLWGSPRIKNKKWLEQWNHCFKIGFNHKIMIVTLKTHDCY